MAAIRAVGALRGLREIEKVEQLPSKEPFSKRFEEAVGEGCDSASARRVAKQVRLSGVSCLMLLLNAGKLTPITGWSFRLRGRLARPIVGCEDRPTENAIRILTLATAYSLKREQCPVPFSQCAGAISPAGQGR
jgi:hypothetical protein